MTLIEKVILGLMSVGVTLIAVAQVMKLFQM